MPRRTEMRAEVFALIEACAAQVKDTILICPESEADNSVDDTLKSPRSTRDLLSASTTKRAAVPCSTEITAELDALIEVSDDEVKVVMFIRLERVASKGPSATSAVTDEEEPVVIETSGSVTTMLA